MAIRPGKKPVIRTYIARHIPRFKPFKVVGKPYIIKGRLKLGRP